MTRQSFPSAVGLFLAIIVVIISLVIKNVYTPIETVENPFCSSQTSLKDICVNDLVNQTQISESLNLDCYFSDTYDDARSKFIDGAKTIGNAIITTLPVMKGYIKRVYNSDVVLIKRNPKKYIIHISGTHGTEGYAGSAIQLALLQYLSDNKQLLKDKALPSILFYHALNPFGFANNRRCNENNVDLNRNFLTKEEFEVAMARDPNFAGYVDVDSIINPTSKPFSSIVLNDLFSIYLIVYGM